MYPKLVIDLNKLNHNIKFLIDLMVKNNLSLTAVTKLFGADEMIVKLFESYEKIEYFADSRITNLKKVHHSKKEKILLRLPMHSEIADVITYADISFNSELSTIKLLNKEAARCGKVHKILLMFDVGDLREGFFEEADLMNAVAKITTLDNIKIIGIGTNLMCYGGIVPDEVNLTRLVEISNRIKETFNLELEMISGANSSALYLLNKTIPSGINNLRIGDAFFTGETSYGFKFPNTYDDIFTLQVEIIELKKKPSYPIGHIGIDAFGKVPSFTDKGERLKAILAVGRQDTESDGLIPVDKDIEILGASSDHLIIDVTDSENEYNVGDILKFKLHYSAVLKAFTSNYVTREYIEIKGK